MISKLNKKKRPLFRVIAIVILSGSIGLMPGCIYTKTHILGTKDCAEPLEIRPYDVLPAKDDGFDFIGYITRIVDIPYEPRIISAAGKSASFKLFWFIPVTPRINYNEAVDEAVLSANGDNLIDVRLYEKKQIWIIGTVDILCVEGKAIKYK